MYQGRKNVFRGGVKVVFVILMNMQIFNHFKKFCWHLKKINGDWTDFDVKHLVRE